MSAARERYVGRFRLLWWKYINFGWLPCLTRNFYGGTGHVLTWGKAWVEW